MTLCGLGTLQIAAHWPGWGTAYKRPSVFGWLSRAAVTESPLCPAFHRLENMWREEGKQLSPSKTLLLETLPATQTTALKALSTRLAKLFDLVITLKCHTTWAWHYTHYRHAMASKLYIYFNSVFSVVFITMWHLDIKHQYSITVLFLTCSHQ